MAGQLRPPDDTPLDGLPLVGAPHVPNYGHAAQVEPPSDEALAQWWNERHPDTRADLPLTPAKRQVILPAYRSSHQPAPPDGPALPIGGREAARRYAAEMPVTEPARFVDGLGQPQPDARALPAFEPGDILAPTMQVERLGPSYRVTVHPPGLRLLFRDVRTDGELAADVSVDIGDRHLFRTTTTLSLPTRDRLARTAVDLAGAGRELPAWREAVFAAVEAVLEAEENLGGGVDLRTAPLTGDRRLHVARPVWENGPTAIVGPGDGGKSTIARAIAVSVAGNLAVIPGIDPTMTGPVLYVAGEDAVAHWHTRSIEAICHGLEIERSSLANAITLFDASGRPIHRIARAIAEQAADYAGVILDPLSAFLAAGDQVRDRDSLFWRAIDTIGRSTLILAHPNRAESRRWAESDGRIAGSEINRDRVRLAWALQWRDEKALLGSSFRRYTLANTKRNHGPALPPLGFAVGWQFGTADDDPGIVSFTPSAPFKSGGELSPELTEALDAYRAGSRTPKPLGEALGIPPNTAKARLRLLKGRGLIGDVEADDEPGND